jgi:hypothetical protein
MKLSIGCASTVQFVMALVCGLLWSSLACTNAVAYQAEKAKDGAAATLSQAELDQLVAPIALYPDALVAQVLMASTYPLEVIEAQRWAKKNEKLAGDSLAKALEEQTWDPSVKSLVNFPQVLTQMNDNIDWMTKLGDAFLAQQDQLMQTVQNLRKKAEVAGNLKSNEQQEVKVETQDNSQVIVIESKSPDVIYVPTYDPVVVYGTWPYPAYPPYHYYPPSYVPGTALVSFGVGVACGLAWGYAWGGCNWGHGHCHVDIDVNRNVNRNTNINRNNINANVRNGQWQHDSSHRKGVSYRDNATAQKYGRSSSNAAVQSREQFRGRAEAGQRDIQSGRVNAGNVNSRDAQSGGSTGNRSSAGTSDRSRGSSPSAGTRDTSRGGSSGSGSGSGSGSAFSGSNRSGSDTRASSSRGSSSRGSSGASRSSGGGSRSGGGGSRSGGGSRGGGGRR